jgi:type II secretory pathway pseudopilin PulG
LTTNKIRARSAGFTLVELLIALTMTMLLLGGLYGMLTTSNSVKARADQYVSLQQTVRSAAEVMAQDMREASGPRITYAGADIPASLHLPASNAQQVTLAVPAPNSSFAVAKPENYPSSNAYPLGQIAMPLVSPNDAGATCKQVFSRGDLAVIYDQEPADTHWVQVSAFLLPCVDSYEETWLNYFTWPNLSRYSLSKFTWTPYAYVSKVDAITYYLDTDALTGRSALYRKVAGHEAQVVAFDMSGLALTYVYPDGSGGYRYTSRPKGAPEAIQFKLTGTTPKDLQGTEAPATFSVTEMVFMRQTMIPDPRSP